MVYQIKDNNIILNSSKMYHISRVKDLPDEERPREKLLTQGVSALNAAELLAIVLGTGTKKEEVLTMANRLLKIYGEKSIIYQKNPEIIKKDLDLPLTKACQIVACFELGKRFYEKKPGKLISIRNSKQAYNYLKDMGKLQKEHFRGLYLNTNYELIHDEIISIGTLNTTVIHPREIFKPALEYSAAALIVAHNHPSGSTKATAADLEVTHKLKEAGKLLEIELLDHIIIGKNKFTSLI